MRADQPYKHQELFLFTYNIPGKYIELSEELAKAFQMEKIFKNMPYSFAEQFVLEEDRPGFCQMYYDIDAGASFATCDFRVNGARSGWNRVCVYRTDMKSDTAFAMVQDVTAHYEMIIEQANRLQLEEIRRKTSDVESMQLMRAITDTYDMIISVNLTRNTYYMISNERFVNHHAADDGVFDDLIKTALPTLPEEYKDTFYQAFSREALLNAYKEGKQDVYLEHQQYDEQGEVHWTGTHVMFVENPYTNDLMEITLCQNIDERIRKEAENKAVLKDALMLAEKANDAKSDFLSRMSHDIRTPMNAIIGMTRIASAQIDDKKKVQECLGKIDVSSKFLLNLVNDILDLSRIESGKMTLNHEEVNLREILQTIAMSSEELARQKEQTFRFELAGNISNRYMGDALRLQQIFLNLISNAHKFTPEKGVISLTAECVDTVGDRDIIKVTVEDSGIGIPEEFRKKLFEPFTQNQSGTNRKGSGLGLAIVQNLLHLMDGNIRVFSEPGKGSRFVVEFPLHSVRENGSDDTVQQREYSVTAKNAGEYEPDAKENDAVVQFNGQRILLVEDNEINQEVAKSILEMYHLQVDVASDGYEAIEKFEQAEQGYYLTVFMDIQMPGIDGYETTRRIRKSTHPDGQRIPIYAMTANAFATDVNAAKQNGMNGHISKPIDFDMVTKIISGLV